MYKIFNYLFKTLLILLSILLLSFIFIRQMQVHFNVPSSWLEKSIYIKTGYFIGIKQAQVVWIDNLPVLKIKQLNVYKDQTKKIELAKIFNAKFFFSFNGIITKQKIYPSIVIVDAVQIKVHLDNSKRLILLLKNILGLQKVAIKTILIKNGNSSHDSFYLNNIGYVNNNNQGSLLTFKLFNKSLAKKDLFIMAKINKLTNNDVWGTLFTDLKTVYLHKLKVLFPLLQSPAISGYVSGHLVVPWHLKFMKTKMKFITRGGECELCQLKIKKADLQQTYQVESVRWQKQIDKSWQLKVADLRYTLKNKQDNFSIEHLNGIGDWQNGYGKLNINSKKIIYRGNKISNDPIIIDSLKSNINFKYKNLTKWEVLFKHAMVRKKHIIVEMQGQLSAAGEDNHHLLMYMHVPASSLLEFKKFLPLKTFPNSLQNWLGTAIKHGDLNHGLVVVNSNIDKFNALQDIQANFVVNHVRIAYAPSWPELIDGQGELLFSQQGFSAKLTQGNLAGVKIKQAQISIENYDKGKLIVSGELLSSLGLAKKVFKNTPVYSGDIEKILAKMNLSGKMTLTMNTVLDLTKRYNSTVSLALALKNTDLSLRDFPLSYKDLHGNIYFSNGRLYTDKLHGELFGAPVWLTINNSSGVDKKEFIANTSGLLTKKLLLNFMPEHLAAYFKGSSKFFAKLTSKVLVDDVITNLQVKSNLKGLGISLPKPFFKSIREHIPFFFKTTVTGDFFSKYNIYLKNKLKINLSRSVKKSANNKWSGVVSIGPDSIKHKNKSVNGNQLQKYKQSFVSIIGAIDDLSYGKWGKVLQDFRGKHNIINSVLISNLKIKKLQGGGLDFHDLILSTNDLSQKKKIIFIQSDELKGKIILPNLANKTTVYNFSSCNFNQQSTRESFVKDIKKYLPAHIICKQAFYEKKKIGSLELNISKDDSKNIKALIQQKNDKFTLSATAEVSRVKNKYQVDLKGSVSYLKISELFNFLGFNPGLHSQIGSFYFDLESKDIKKITNIKDINGFVYLNLKRGSLDNVNSGVAPLINLLSVNKLAKRLTLDFSDVFSKGYYFDNLKGNFSINNGIVETNNLTLDGDSAFIKVVGTSNLINKKLNIDLDVMPHYTAPVPLALAILTSNPLAAVGAWVIDYLYKIQDKDPEIYNYTVRGKLDNPEINKIMKKE